MKLKHIVILQNKIDLVKEAQAKEQYEQILKFIQGTLLYSSLLSILIYKTIFLFFYLIKSRDKTLTAI